MRPVRVVVVDDHAIVRAGLAALLGREPDIHVQGTASSGEEGIRLVRELEPDVAVVDYSLPGISGVEVCEILTRRTPSTPVVMLTSYLNDEVVHRAVEAGARAYVYKDVDGRQLARAIRSVARGEAVIDGKVAGRIMQWAQKRRTVSDMPALSPRETDILRLVARGAGNGQIAGDLGLSENSVKTYLQRALGKLNCHSRAEAAAVAAKLGLL